MARHEAWPSILAGKLEEMAAKPFSWGSHDCALAACDVVLAITGIDLGEPFRGRYTDRAGAIVVLAARGGLETAVAAIAADAGFLEVPVKRAQRGDVVLLDTVDGPAVGVVDMDGCQAVFPGPEGAARVRLRDCRRAWRVG